MVKEVGSKKNSKVLYNRVPLEVEGGVEGSDVEQIRRKPPKERQFCSPIIILLCILFVVVVGVAAWMFNQTSSDKSSDPHDNYVVCPPLTEQYTGTPFPDGTEGPHPAPLRGNIGCIDRDVVSLRDVSVYPVDHGQDLTNRIFGPMQNSYPADMLGEECLGVNASIRGSVDTLTGELMVNYACGGKDYDKVHVLDGCGGHALPYHYHERFTCFYTADSSTEHSTRIGTAADGNGIYGRYIDGGVEPSDLDACGGRFGVTPDSNGEVVYYYPVKPYPPFIVGCYGPVNTVQECRDLYPEKCGDSAVLREITTRYGTGLYTEDCPCFDENHSNVLNSTERPAFLPPEFS